MTVKCLKFDALCVNRCKILENKDLGLTKVGKALNTRHRVGVRPKESFSCPYNRFDYQRVGWDPKLT